MTLELKKWGNSLGIRLPKKVLDELSIDENDTLDLQVKKQTLIIKKENNPKTLEDRLVEFYKKPLNEIEKIKSEEYDWGDVKGAEIW